MQPSEALYTLHPALRAGRLLPFAQALVNDADEVVRLIREAGRKGIAIPGDLREEKFCNKLIADAVE